MIALEEEKLSPKNLEFIYMNLFFIKFINFFIDIRNDKKMNRIERLINSFFLTKNFGKKEEIQ